MIEILQTRVMRGRSILAPVPVIQMVVDYGELGNRSSTEIPDLAKRLLDTVPTINAETGTDGHVTGFGARLRDGLLLHHVLAHLSIEIQRFAAQDLEFGPGEGLPGCGEDNVVYPYCQEDVGLAAGRLAVRLLNRLIDGPVPSFEMEDIRREIVLLADERAYGPSTLEIVSEAEHRGIPVLRLDPERSLVQLGQGRHQRRIWATRTSMTAGVAEAIAGNKELTNRLIADVGIPSPRGAVVRTAEQAVAQANQTGYPVVLKPLDGNHGRGVCLDLGDEQDVQRMFPIARSESRSGAVLVERQVRGKDFRVLVVGSQIVAVAERVPAHVVGDGHHTVQELIDLTNADPRRGIGHEKALTRIPVDARTLDLLDNQGLTLGDVPEDGRTVQLQRTANMSTGGTAIDRTDEIHPDNVEIALQAAMVVGLDVAGIDFVMPDISRSLHEAGGAVVEVNAAPGFRMHTYPTEGLPRQVGRAVLDALFPPGQPARVPIVAVTGTNGKTTTSRMIAHLLQAAGHTVGLTTSDGIYVNGTQIATGDMAGPDSARMVLKNPRVDAAVLETARGGILRAGLGFDQCNVAVVTNVSSDHLGLKGVETIDHLAEVKGVVPASVAPGGTSVLNADNIWTVGMESAAGGEVIYFSMREDSPVIRRHVRNNGRALVLRETPHGGMLTLIEAKRETSILLAREIPATFDERVRVNIANALAATAAALGAGISLSAIRNGLRSFSAAYWQTPGRFNVMMIEGKQVVVDYCHNVDALEWIADFVRRTAAPRAIGVIAIAGDRRDEDIRAFGWLAGQTFDHLIIREHDDLRGRRPGEVAGLLRTAALDAGMPAERITLILHEIDAVLEAVDLASPGDLVVAMVYRIPRVWQALSDRREADVSTYGSNSRLESANGSRDPHTVSVAVRSSHSLRQRIARTNTIGDQRCSRRLRRHGFVHFAANGHARQGRNTPE